jgi:hypothetical protein
VALLQPSSWEVEYIEQLPSVKEQHLELTGIDALDLPSLHMMFLSKLSSIDVHRMPSPPSEYSMQYCFSLKNSFFMSKK